MSAFGGIGTCIAAVGLYVENVILFPVAVDVPMARWPWMNWLMMAAIAFCFVIQLGDPALAEPFILGIDGDPSRGEGNSIFALLDAESVEEHPLSWIGHMFLHGDLLHLLGNLLFMWLFGNAVCAKIGNLLYPLLWIGCGLLAALAQRAVDSAPMLGASGAIFGIVGFYIVYYVRNHVTMFFFLFVFLFFYKRTFQLAGYWVVLLYLGFDLFGIASSADGVAHFAHLGGFAAGFALGITLVISGILPESTYERSLLSLFRDRSKSSLRQTRRPG